MNEGIYFMCPYLIYCPSYCVCGFVRVTKRVFCGFILWPMSVEIIILYFLHSLSCNQTYFFFQKPLIYVKKLKQNILQMLV